jgi:hypothetical protein
MSYEYDDLEDFYGECMDTDLSDYEVENDSFDDSMDGDAESALASAGWGTDEDYGYYGDDGVEDFHADDDGPYDD